MRSDSAQAFGELLRLHRIAMAFSQEELAERAGISPKAVSALERGTRKAPYPDTVARLAGALLLDPDARSAFENVAKRARLRTREQQPLHNLPSPVTSLFGREEALGELQRLIERHRLVTITGSGGVGKTRAAIEVARRELHHFSDGVWLCDLAPLVDERSVITSISSLFSVVAEPDGAVRVLTEKLSGLEVLLLVDNCEHLRAHVARLVNALLRGSSSLKIIATSRERLSLSGEAVFPLPSLAIAAATQLFLDRAELADPSFACIPEQEPLIADICRKVDGIPLAIEIAAAQLRTRGIAGLGRALDENLSLLASGLADVPPRQQTMNAAIAWSYRLLDPRQQAVFRRAAIFAGDFGPDAAKAVCASEELSDDAVPGVMSSLADKSLVIVDLRGDEPRYRLLESARQFGDEKLRIFGEYTAVAHRHARWAADFVEAVRTTFFTLPREEWETRLTREFKNIYSAMQRMLEPQNDALLGARILGGLETVWRFLGRTGEAARLADLLLERIDAAASPEVAGRLLLAKTHALFGLERLKILERASEFFATSRNARELRRCYAHIATTELELGRLARAEQACAWSATYFAVFEPDFNRRALILADLRAELFVRRGEFERAREQLALGVELAERFGDPRAIKAACLAGAAELDFVAGELRRALESYRKIPILADHDYRKYIYVRIAECHVMLGQLDAATEAADVGLADDVAQLYMKLLALQCAAHVAALAGDPARGARLIGFVDACFARSAYHRDRQDQVCYNALRGELELRLPQHECVTLMREGSTLELDDAVKLATPVRRSRTFATTQAL
jgi:predicted ATPase/DNA-binding XRE family transcriptional regulator